jgi:hypothetical protein
MINSELSRVASRLYIFSGCGKGEDETVSRDQVKPSYGCT